MSFEVTQQHDENPEPQFQPLTREQRRIVGVLIEKSKTTPNAYPMTINSITTGSNQKSNRSPQMKLAADDVEFLLDELREMGAVAEIRGDGRVSKYKHKMYQWLGVEKVEIAVMGELLLRGEQTLGELRARAARMEPIAGMDELKPLLRSLIDKGLVVELTPSGRGQIITHNLYQPHELEHLRGKVGSGVPAEIDLQPAPSDPLTTSTESTSASTNQDADVLRQLAELTEKVEFLTARVEQLEQGS